jgi:hypothetical protein
MYLSVIKQEIAMNTYLVRAHIEKIGMVEESVRTNSENDARLLIEARYRPAKVVLYGVKKIS